MPPEIAGLIETPQLAVPALLIGALVGLAFERVRSRRRRRAWQGRGRGRWQGKRTRSSPLIEHMLTATAAPKQPDAADQLRIVMGAGFAIQPLLNRSESRLFHELDRLVLARNPDWHVMAQVSLGENLRSQDVDAYACVNSKAGRPAAGRPGLPAPARGRIPGHRPPPDRRPARDAVKKEALRRAGIGYHEVVAGYTTPSDLRRLVEKLVDEEMG